MRSLHIVFVPLIQDDVDRHIVAWNNHRVRAIKENGRYLKSHVPETAFQSYERRMGWLQPPAFDEEDNHRYEAIRATIDEPLDQMRDENGPQGIPPAPPDHSEAALPNVLHNIRDAAYEMGRSNYRYDEEKYLFHLGLTGKCVGAMTNLHMSVEEYFRIRASEVGQNRLPLLQMLLAATPDGM